jgi:AcrR family transcriptional regulator
MPAEKPTTRSPSGRQSAYLARNRLSLIRAAQRVLAEIGPNASIEQLSTHAEVSPTTIYKYFENKEVLFQEAIGEIWKEWVEWSYQGIEPGEKLEDAIDVARKLFWLEHTHPLLAKILRNTLSNPSFVITAVRHDAENLFKNFASRGVIREDGFEQRIILYAYSIAGLLNEVYVTRKLTPEEAEKSLVMGLAIWGVSEAKMKKILSRQLTFPKFSFDK